MKKKNLGVMRVCRRNKGKSPNPSKRKGAGDGVLRGLVEESARVGPALRGQEEKGRGDRAGHKGAGGGQKRKTWLGGVVSTGGHRQRKGRED